MFNKVGVELFWDMAHWLGKIQVEHATHDAQVQRRNTFRTPAVQLIMPTEYKAKRFVQTWHNPYTAPEKVLAEKARYNEKAF